MEGTPQLGRNHLGREINSAASLIETEDGGNECKGSAEYTNVPTLEQCHDNAGRDEHSRPPNENGYDEAIRVDERREWQTNREGPHEGGLEAELKSLARSVRLVGHREIVARHEKVGIKEVAGETV